MLGWNTRARCSACRGGDGEAWRFALLSYGLVADEWENLRGIAAPSPEKTGDNARVIQRPADDVGEAIASARTALP